MRYKVGDKVVIRKDLEYNTNYCMENNLNEWSYFTHGMCSYTGEQEIYSTKDERYQLSSDTDNQKYNFTDGMIDHEATAKLHEVKPKQLLKNGSVVVLRDGSRYLILTNIKEVNEEMEFVLVSDESFRATNRGYNDDLTSAYGREESDIIEIHDTIAQPLSRMLFHNTTLVWQRQTPQPEPKVIKMTSAELLVKLGLDGNTKIEIYG